MGKVTICGGVVARPTQRMYQHTPTMAQTARNKRAYQRCAGANRKSAEIHHPETQPVRTIVLKGLRPDTVLPTITPKAPPTMTAPHAWAVSIRAYPVSVPKTTPDGAPVYNPKTGEQERVFVGIRRVLDAVTTGGPDNLDNHWRIIVTDRKGKGQGADKVQCLTLASWDGRTFDTNDKGEDVPHYVKDRALSHSEAVTWLDGRTNGKGASTLAALLTAHPQRQDKGE